MAQDANGFAVVDAPTDENGFEIAPPHDANGFEVVTEAKPPGFFSRLLSTDRQSVPGIEEPKFDAQPPALSPEELDYASNLRPAKGILGAMGKATSVPETEGGIVTMDTPTVPLGDMLLKETKDAASPTEAGIIESLRPTLNGLTSRRNIAYMLGSMGVANAGRYGAKLVSALWTAVMGKELVQNTPETWRQLGEEMGKPEEQRDRKKIAKLLTDTGTATAFTMAPALHLGKPTPTPTIEAPLEVVSPETAPGRANGVSTPVSPDQSSAQPAQRATAQPVEVTPDVAKDLIEQLTKGQIVKREAAPSLRTTEPVTEAPATREALTEATPDGQATQISPTEQFEQSSGMRSGDVQLVKLVAQRMSESPHDWMSTFNKADYDEQREMLKSLTEGTDAVVKRASSGSWYLGRMVKQPDGVLEFEAFWRWSDHPQQQGGYKNETKINFGADLKTIGSRTLSHLDRLGLEKDTAAPVSQSGGENQESSKDSLISARRQDEATQSGNPVNPLAAEAAPKQPTVAEPQSAPSKPKGKNPFWVRPRSDGVPDILDDIQELGGIRPPGPDAGGEYDGFGEAMTGTARMLVKKSAVHAPDTLIQELHSMGNQLQVQTPDDLWNAVKSAVKDRQRLATTGGGHEAQTVKFWSAVLDPKNKSGLERINVQQLKVGDTFRIRGPGISHEELTVTHLDHDTGDIQVKDGPKLGVQDIPDGTQLWVKKGADILREEPPLFGKPESIEEQKSRVAREMEQRRKASDKEEIAKRQARSLEGKQGDIGQKDMFGGGDLFSETTGDAPTLDGVATDLYGKPYDELPEYEQGQVRATFDSDLENGVQRRKQYNDAARRELANQRESEAHAEAERQQSSELQRSPATAASPELIAEAADLRRQWNAVRSQHGDSAPRQTFQRTLGDMWRRLRTDALLTIADALRPQLDVARRESADILAKVPRRNGEMDLKAFKSLPDEHVDKVMKAERLQSAITEAEQRIAQSSGIVYPGAEARTLNAIDRLLQGGDKKAALTDAERLATEGPDEPIGQMQLLEKPTPYKASIGSGIKAALEKNQSGEAGFVRIPSRQELLDHFTDLGDQLREAAKYVSGKRRQLVERLKRGGDFDNISRLKDAAENMANLMGKETGNFVRHDLNRAFGVKAERVRKERNGLRESALTFAIEATGDKARLAEWRYLLTRSEVAPRLWRRRALQAIEFADTHWDKLQPVVETYRRITDAENAYENANGIATLYREGGYVFHAQDLEATYNIGNGGLVTQGAGGAATPFRKGRDYPTYAEAIANGVNPKSLNGVDLLEHRVSIGQRAVNMTDWIVAMQHIQDKATKLPVVVKPEWVERTGNLGPSHREFEGMPPAKDTQGYYKVPPHYEVIEFGGKTIGLHKGFTGLFSSLTDPSWFQKSAGRKAFAGGMAFAKHTALLFDTYHLGRLAFWNSLSRGALPHLPTYDRGLSILENTLPELQRMVSRGEIPKEWGKGLIESKTRLDAVMRVGGNLSSVGDNLHTEFLQRVPGLGTFNKWLFNKYQRGAMAEVALMEFDRQAKLNPGEDINVTARRVAKDVNTRFGNLQSQAWLKSKTGQDLARVLFLAPQWNESLIRSELGAVKQFGQAGANLARGKRPALGMLARGIGSAVLGTFIANQIINLYTRGTPTWDNPEEEAGAKISAWIPDKVGGGPGYFLNPLSLPAEMMNLLYRGIDRNKGKGAEEASSESILAILKGRMSPLAKGIYTWVTGETPMGVKVGHGFGTAVKEAIPAPISGGAVFRGVKQVVTGEHQEKYPGEFEKQIMQSFGVKTEQAPSPEKRIRTLAVEFNSRHKVSEDTGAYAPSRFADLIAAIRRQNMSDAKEALDTILTTDKANGEPTQPKDVYAYFKKWESAAFTKAQRRETQFRATLNTEQRKVYDQARKDRIAIAQKVNAMLKAKIADSPQAVTRQ